MTRIRPAELIRKYYKDNPEAMEILLEHSRKVTRRALQIARRMTQHEELDIQFIAEAAMLHDIGMIMTDVPDLHCSGSAPYLQHGLLGAEILNKEGFPRHARVCERHIGIGLTAEEIIREKLPLPARDMIPETVEEQIICYADLFFSKGKKNRHQEKSHDKVRKNLNKYGKDKTAVFDRWQQCFEPDAS